MYCKHVDIWGRVPISVNASLPCLVWCLFNVIFTLWIFLPSLVRINVWERWTSSSPSLDRCCWRPTWRPEDWTFPTSTASSTTTSPLTPRYRGADGHIAGLFDVFICLIWSEWIFGCVCPHRTTSIGSGEQPEQGALGNPSLLSLSKNCPFLTNVLLFVL